MPLTLKTKGVTLIELLVAVAMIVTVVSALSTFFPKASQALSANRQRLIASRLAQSAMMAATRSPYDLIDATPLPAPCNCSTVDFSTLPPDLTTVVNGISYVQKKCVNLVDNTHLPSCGPTDFGLKKIRVHLSWTVGGNTFSMDTESMAARL